MMASCSYALPLACTHLVVHVCATAYLPIVLVVGASCGPALSELGITENLKHWNSKVWPNGIPTRRRSGIPRYGTPGERWPNNSGSYLQRALGDTIPTHSRAHPLAQYKLRDVIPFNGCKINK